MLITALDFALSLQVIYYSLSNYQTIIPLHLDFTTFTHISGFRILYTNRNYCT